MGLLYMASQEHELNVKFIAEAAKLLGQECWIYQPLTITSDIQQDRAVTYKTKVKANILFESNPQPVLKNYNWISEDDTLPYIAYITNLDDNYEDIVIERDCIVEVPQAQMNEVSNKKFIITFLKGSKINPLFWTCKLVPYREKVEGTPVVDEEAPNNSEMGYTYVQRRKP